MSEPRTINLPGSGTDTQQHELAPGLLQYVESVYVEIDNSAGGDARPTLTLAEQSGVVIAKKRQGEAIGGGNSGSATWALRLTDEQPAAAVQSAYARFTGQQMADGVTKILAPGSTGTIIIPLDWYIVASNNYSPSGGQPDLDYEAPTQGWDNHNVDSFGVTFYNNASGYGIAPGTNSVPLSVTGEPLQVTSVPNGATSGVGHVEVFVHYERVKVSP